MLDAMMDSGDKLFQVAKFTSKPGFRELIQKEIVFIEIPVGDLDSFRIPGKWLILSWEILSSSSFQLFSPV